LAAAEPTPKQQGEVDFLFTLGEMLTLPYAQLILEQTVIDETDPDVIDQLFEVLVSDFSVHTTKLHCKTTATPGAESPVIDAVDDGRGGLGDHCVVVTVLLRHASDHSGPLPAAKGTGVVRLQRRPATWCARYVVAAERAT
jgi:hypothetical protein